MHEKKIESIISSAIKSTPKATNTNTERMRNVGQAREKQLESERLDRRPKTKVTYPSSKVISLRDNDDIDEYPTYEDELFDDGDD